MPQFDSTFFTSQIFWLLVIFLGLFLYIKFVFLPRLTSIIDEREKRISQDLEGAEKLHQEIEMLLKHHQNLLFQAKEDSRMQMNDCIVHLAQRQEVLLSKVESEIQENIREFQRSAARQHEQVTKGIRPLIERNVEAALKVLLKNSSRVS